MKTNNVGLIPNNARRKLRVASTYALFIALITSCCFTHSFAAGPDDWPATETFTPEGIAMPIEGDVMRSSALSCRPGIQISLNHFGYGVVTPTSMLYVMNFPENMYEVTVQGGSDTVTCADIGSTLMATVREIPTGNTCMTELTVEDKLPPFLSCSADTLPCNVDIQSLDFLSFIDTVFDNCTPIEDVEITYAYTVTELDCDPNGIAAIIDVTYTAEDNMGFQSTCEQSIYLEKYTLDDVVFPNDTILGCVDPDTSPENVGVPTVGGEPIDHFCELLAWNDDTEYDVCSGEFKISRVWSVMDWCTGETRMTMQTVYVKDTFPPDIDCPEDLVLGTDQTKCFATYTFPDLDVTDVCSDDSQIQLTFRITGEFATFLPGHQIELAPGSYTVTATAVDDCLTEGTCEYDIEVIDDEDPVLVCNNYTTNLNEFGFSILKAESAQFFASDNCGIDSIAVRKMVDVCDNDPDDTEFGPQVTFCCDEAGTTVMVIFKAIDFSGNENECMIEVQVKDATPPNAECKDIMVFLDDNGQAIITPEDIDNGSTDNCEIVSLEIDRDSFACSDLHESLNPATVTLKVTDASGNMAVCQSLVTVKDTTPPQAFCEDITVMLDQSGFASITPFDVDAGSIDNCQIVFRSVEPDTFTCADVGNTIMAEFIVIDQSGNSDTCISEIMVMDNPPVVICKDATLELDENGMVVVTQEDIDDAMDDCGPLEVEITPSELFCANIGDNEVNLKVTDIFGNMASCNSTVTVVDLLPPTCTTQDITVFLDENGMASIDGDAVDNGSSDNCQIVSITVEPSTFDCGDVGSVPVVVTQTVTDQSGNSSTCTANVTVINNNPPECTTMDIEVYLDEDGQVSIANDAVDGGSGGACAIASITVEPNEFDCEDVGPVIVTQTVTDENGNSATCTATVTVLDTIAPTCVTQDITVFLDESGAVSISADQIDNGSSDNCEIESIEITPDAFDCSNIPSATVTMTVTDENGNSSVCDATVTVQDTVAPTCLTMDITIMLDENGTATIENDAVDDGSSDACGIETITLDQTMFDCSDGDSVVVTQTVTDVNGNSSMCTATVFIENSVGPSAVCVDTTVYLDANGMVSITPDFVNGGSSTNCGEVTLMIDIMDFECDDIGDNTVTLTVTDEGGAMASCTATVTVLDTISPVCMTNDLTVELDEMGMGSITLDDVNNGSSDNCDVELSIDLMDFTCDNIGDTTVVLTAVDPSMNTSTCDANITILDNLPPMCSSVDSIFIVLPGNGMASITVDQVDDGSTDNCTIVSRVIDQTMFNCDDIGNNIVTLTVTDQSGNSSTCTTVVVVEDGMNFQCNTNDITVELGPDGIVIVAPEDVDNGTGGGCNAEQPMLSLEPDTFTCMNIGPNNVILTVTTSTDTLMCPAVVTIVDNTAPVIVCPADVTVDCGTDLGDLSQFGMAMATDNCTDPVDITEDQMLDFDDCGQGTATRIFTATDESGNSSQCVQTITVGSEPLDAGDITFPPAMVDLPECSSTDPEDIPNGEPVVDLPQGSCAQISITFQDSVINVDCDMNPNAPCVTIFRTWTVFDSCNSDNVMFTSEQVITVTDNTGPIFAPINDITIDANAPDDTCLAMVSLMATATSCGENVMNITNDYNDGGADASGIYPLGTTTVTFMAEDECCNVSMLQVDVTVVDPGNPTWTCFKDIICVPPSGIIEVVPSQFVMFANPDGCSSKDDYFYSFTGTPPYRTDSTFSCDIANGPAEPIMVFVFTPDTGTLVFQCLGDLEVNDGPENGCPGTNCFDPELTISGSVTNELGMNINQVPVLISESGMAPIRTDNSGNYTYTGLYEGFTYNVGPYSNEDPLRGVSTLDLLAIQKHLLGIKELNSPYKRIAADVNGDGQISVFDLVELRKLLLGINTEFEQNTSWNFVDRGFDFPDQYDPWMTEWPTEMEIELMDGSKENVDFIGIKTGDVNVSFQNVKQDPDKNDRRTLALTITDESYAKGDQVKIPVRVANFEALEGMQFSIEVNNLLAEVSEIEIPQTSILDLSNFGLKELASGKVNVSWSAGPSVDRSPEEVLFYVVVNAKSDGSVSDLLSIDLDGLSAEAYYESTNEAISNVELFYAEERSDPAEPGLALQQNRPNPFSTRTQIPFFLSDAGSVELIVHSVDGKVVFTRDMDLSSGAHVVEIDHTELPGSGVYYYTLVSEKNRATSKMTLLE